MAEWSGKSMISPSVNVFFSARWREAIAGISAEADGGQTTAPHAIVTKAAAAIVKREDRLIAATLPQSPHARKAYRSKAGDGAP